MLAFPPARRRADFPWVFCGIISAPTENDEEEMVCKPVLMTKGGSIAISAGEQPLTAEGLHRF